jgi:hypothetical protein
MNGVHEQNNLRFNDTSMSYQFSPSKFSISQELTKSPVQLNGETVSNTEDTLLTKRSTWTQKERFSPATGRIHPHENKENIHLRSISISRTVSVFFGFHCTVRLVTNGHHTGPGQNKKIETTNSRTTRHVLQNQTT